MARSTFGGGAADFLATVNVGGLVRAIPGTLTFWSASSGGVQYTDLLLDGSPVSSISVGSNGQVPLFQGPDGVGVMWADAGHGRVRLISDKTGAELASDTFIAETLNDPASDSRTAVDGLIEAGVTPLVTEQVPPLVADAIASDPTVAAAAADLAQSDAGLAKSLPLYGVSPDEGFIGDAAGRPSKVGFDGEGEIAEVTMVSAVGKGMARALDTTTDDYEIAVGDAAGEPTWMQADAEGVPTETARWAMANTLHTYTGPEEPFVYPDNFILWTETDATGEPLYDFDWKMENF